MLALNEIRDNRSLRRSNGDKVVFKNVQKRYKFPSTITVEFILSPKIKTSTHDYVGIYPCNWKNLTDFVGFEHPIPAPFEEPNLYRCLQFTCQHPHVRAVLHQDYQFVYINQSQEILGKSDFFQFVGEDFVAPDTSIDWQDSEWWNDSQKQDDNTANDQVDTFNLHLTPYEIAYNECFFGNQTTDRTNNTFTESVDAAGGGSDETSNGCFTSKETSNVYYMSEGYERKKFYKQNSRKCRAVVKTRDDSHLGYGNNSPEPNKSHSLSQNSYTRDQGVNTGPDLTYSNNWLQFKKNSDMRLIPTLDKSSPGGAIPKQCSKCHAPPDYNHKQMIIQHELSQAYEQIRDLKKELDKVKNDLQLSQAAHAKLKALADIANATCHDAVTFHNNLMLSLVTQPKTRIVNYDGSIMYVSREMVSPGWMAQQKQPRRQGFKFVSEREKLMKAVIGHQENKIRELNSKLVEAHKIITQAGMDGKVTVSKTNKDYESAEDSSNCVPTQRSSLDLSNLTKAVKDIHTESSSSFKRLEPEIQLRNGNVLCVAMVHNSGDAEEDNLPTPLPDEEKDTWEEAVVIEPKCYHVNLMQSRTREVISNADEILEYPQSEESNSFILNEANNNNYVTKNKNSEKEEKEVKCGVCVTETDETSGTLHIGSE